MIQRSRFAGHVAQWEAWARVRFHLLKILYNPTIGANIICGDCTLHHLGDEPLVPTNTFLKTPYGELLEGVGILQNVSIRHGDIEAILDFHVFNVKDFNLMIGHPIEKLLIDAPSQEKLKVQYEKDTFYVQISRAKNFVTDPSNDYEPIEEVKWLLPFYSPESHLKKDSEEFTDKEEEHTEPIDISEF